MKVAHDHTAHSRLVVVEPGEVANHGLSFSPELVYLRIRWEDGGAGQDVVATVYGPASAKRQWAAFGHPGAPLPAWLRALVEVVL
jgi:hypothetical protein